MRYQRIQIGNLGWRGRIGLVVAVALAFGLAIGLIILAFGIALLLLPLVAIASVIGWLRWRRLMAEASRRDGTDGGKPDGRIIDTEYKVIDGRGDVH